MMPPEILQELQRLFEVEAINFTSVGGGSINEAFSFRIGDQDFFIKYNEVAKYPNIIQFEVEGLAAIAATNTIKTPQVIHYKKLDAYELLVLPFIETQQPTQQFWQKFGLQLANMHLSSQQMHFGYSHNNYIGSLPQSNQQHQNYLSFFLEERLQKQIKLANQNGLLSHADNAAFESLQKQLPQIIPEARPCLVHGDLWNGNFIAGQGQTPYLIDPSIHFSFRETDLAFTYLFGGFHTEFYQSYEESYPLAPGFQERIGIYNLYPLLVHLNLFGSAYLGSIRSILTKFA